MLEFIDRYADERFKNNTRLKVVSIWIGSVSDKKSLKKYISAEAPENGQFVRDMGAEWFDHDFIAGGYQKRDGPVEQVVNELVQALGCPQQIRQVLLMNCTKRGVQQANATVCLMQHVYKGDEHRDFNGLAFVGNYEYEHILDA
ncbi:hypothetical protein W822_08040 [Advenella kashmirensis W13003]|uniref:Uncharacterized protein n=1 Tax=Advenella kashmirensis W13003 TaxID=1424334 RepID=V8QVT1_9BURK|nr:immunity 22 family protein [Advenella kashmirensis]ETF03468.1 hypothetical protein W822_08040 [Advenella kashmirensis W13003]